MAQTIDVPLVVNPRRGCGHLVPGGFYARGMSSVGGRLAAWTWCLGDGLIGGDNLYISAPPRTMTMLMLAETLHHGKVMTERESHDNYLTALQNLPQVALLDHVGEDNYTPAQFADECRRLGPSRRIPENLAETIAPYLPLPILFTHQQMPILDRAVQSEAFAVLFPEEFKPWLTPTHTNTKWGVYAGSWDGGTHWLTFLLRLLNENKGRHLTQALPPRVAEDLLFGEQPFGLSWITGVHYVVKGSETNAELAEMKRRSIKPVRAGNAE